MRHFFLSLTALLLVLVGLGVPAAAQDPVLTITFTGNTYGTYEPCPS